MVQPYGFRIDAFGLGAYGWNIFICGQAFGVTNDTVLSVYQILQAANSSAVGGTPWASSSFIVLQEAQAVFFGINKG